MTYLKPGNCLFPFYNFPFFMQQKIKYVRKGSNIDWNAQHATEGKTRQKKEIISEYHDERISENVKKVHYQWKIETKFIDKCNDFESFPYYDD